MISVQVTSALPWPGMAFKHVSADMKCWSKDSLAMQAANVHAILEGGPMVASTVQRTGEAARAVDDLAETLAIFDLKLRHMREAGSTSCPLPEACNPTVSHEHTPRKHLLHLSVNGCVGTQQESIRAWQLRVAPPVALRKLTSSQDIAAIEARNNRLERQARHNAALMDSVERLLERLVLPEQTERILNTSTFNYGMCVTTAATPFPLEQSLLKTLPPPLKSICGGDVCTAS